MGAARPLISPLFFNLPYIPYKEINTFLLYILYTSHSILTGVAFCVYACGCFVRS
nr:MAG TPA: hypothetical protein [Caudoviricetes sp.]